MDGPFPKVAYFEITGLDDYHIGMDYIIIYLWKGQNIFESPYFVLDNLSVPSISYEFLGLTYFRLFTNVPKGIKDCSSFKSEF